MWLKLVLSFRLVVSLSLASLCGDSWSVSSLRLLVVLASTGLSESVHAVNLILRADPAEVVDLADSTIHALFDLLEGEAQEAFAAHDLSLLGDRVFCSFVQRGLPLRDADEHVLLGLEHWVNGLTFAALNSVDNGLGRGSVETEAATEDVLAVEGGEHGDVPSDADAHDEKFIGPTSHSLDLSLDNLLHVRVPLRLEQVLALRVPRAATALVILLDDYGRLHGDHIDKFVESENFVRRLDEERLDVLLRALAVVVQEDARGVPGIHQAAIWRGHRLEDNVVANVVLEKAVLCDRLSGFFSAHLCNSWLSLLLAYSAI